MKIIIGNKRQQTNYFELDYTFNLDVPQSQLGKESLATTKTLTGNVGYKDGADIKDIQNDLIERFNKAQTELNNDTKLSFYGMAWDGKDWA